MVSTFIAGAGKSVLWYVKLPNTFISRTYGVGQFDNHTRDSDDAKVWACFAGILLP